MLRTFALGVLLLLWVSACGLSQSTLTNFHYSNTSLRFGMNDVSVLFPLPESEADLEELIPVTAEGKFGVLLPETLVPKLPVLRSGMPREETVAELRVIAVRFDPCFRETSGDVLTPCVPQIRMVAQPVLWDELNRRSTTRDLALHFFYKVPADELTELLKQVRLHSAEARDLIANAALTIHPLMKSQGLRGAFSHWFQNRILESTGEARLWRVTFMTVAGRDLQWTFGGFDVANGTYTDIRIPGIGSLRQTISSNINIPIPMINFVVPYGRATDHLSMFDSGPRLLRATEAEQRAAIRALYRVENPSMHNPGSVDCVSCHMTKMAKAWSIENNLPNANGTEDMYKSSFNLADKSAHHPRAAVLRSFGYFNDDPAISQRVINETASLLESLNAR